MTLTAEHCMSRRLRLGILPSGIAAQPRHVAAQCPVQPDSSGLPPVGVGGRPERAGWRHVGVFRRNNSDRLAEVGGRKRSVAGGGGQEWHATA